MDVFVLVSILVGAVIGSMASDLPNTTGNAFAGLLSTGMGASSVHSPNFSHPILETVEKKKHLFIVLEEEEQDKTFLPVDQFSEPNDENQRYDKGQRNHYSSTLEDQLQMVPSSVDHQLVNGPDGVPKQPSLEPSNHNYIIPILLCLGLLLALLILFTQYIKWKDEGNHLVTDNNFFFKLRAIEVPPAPKV